MTLLSESTGIQRRMQAQRTARLAAQALESERRNHRTSAANFFDNIDTSGGPDACHEWLGERKFNHPPGMTRFEQGQFRYEGCDSRIATRVLCFATYGKEPPKDADILPLCDNHLCCNVRHLYVTPHGGHGAQRFNRAVPVAEFFCDAQRRPN